MSEFALALAFRNEIEDAAVVEELDRAYARLNGFLRGLGQVDAEGALEDGEDPGSGVQISTFADLSGPFILPTRAYSLSSDVLELDPGDATILRVTPVDAARTISGIKGGRDGRVIKLFVPRSASQTLTLAHAASGAQANRRLDLVGAADITSVAGEPRAWTFWFDAVDNAWQMEGGSAAIAAAVHQSLVQSGTQGATGANTDETDLWVGTLPANTFSVNGDVVHIRMFGNLADNTNTKNLRFYFDGVEVVATGVNGWQNQGWQLHVMIIRRGSNDQALHAQFYPAITGLAPNKGEFVTDTADDTATIDFKMTGQNGTSAAGDITFEAGHAFKINAA